MYTAHFEPRFVSYLQVPRIRDPSIKPDIVPEGTYGLWDLRKQTEIILLFLQVACLPDRRSVQYKF